MSGLFVITDINVNGDTGLFLNGLAIALVAQTSNKFTVTATTAGKINVYRNANVITIENKLGVSLQVRVIALRTRTTG